MKVLLDVLICISHKINLFIKCVNEIFKILAKMFKNVPFISFDKTI